MNTAFRFVGLPREPFAPLSGLTEDELAARGMRRLIADCTPGYPCRVSLTDAAVGERVILLTYTHHDVDSPYRASGPIFVREDARAATPAIGEVPPYLRQRLLSLRAYDRQSMMVGAEVLEGARLEEQIRRFLTDERVAYLHVHNARPGCYNCAVVRVSAP